MKTRYEVLSQGEVERICAAAFEILAEVGVKCDYGKALDLFRQAGAHVDESAQSVRLPESVARRSLADVPKTFALYGNDPSFQMEVGGERVQFACLGTPTHILDLESGARREVVMEDVREHIKIVSALEHIHSSQMDVWPCDVPMTTIHAEAILAWAKHSRKSFGMGCYGFLPTVDMMRMMAIVAGGKEELRKKPRFFTICSVGSPLQMIKMQLEGMLVAADYGQPITMAPEEIAGSTAPVTLAGLLAHQTANIVAHLALAQIYRPGTPVLYGTVSTIPNMRTGTVALGAVETGMITAAAAQIARHLGVPIRSVGGTTESKLEDMQTGIERTSVTLQAVLAGVHFITCAGTLDSSMLASPALLVVDDEIAAMALRAARGIEVNDETLALDLIRQVNFTGNYLAEAHTARNFRKEHFMPKLFVREPYDTWAKEGQQSMWERARERTRAILAAHQPNVLDAAMEEELLAYLHLTRQRSVEDYLSFEEESKQDLSTL